MIIFVAFCELGSGIVGRYGHNPKIIELDNIVTNKEIISL